MTNIQKLTLSSAILSFFGFIPIGLAFGTNAACWVFALAGVFVSLFIVSTIWNYN